MFEREESFKKRLCEWRSELRDALRHAQTPAETELITALTYDEKDFGVISDMFVLLSAMPGREVVHALRSANPRNLLEELALTFWNRGPESMLEVASGSVGDWCGMLISAALASPNKQVVPWEPANDGIEGRAAQWYGSRPRAAAAADSGEALCLEVLSCLMGMRGSADVKVLSEACLCWLLDKAASEQPPPADLCTAAFERIAAEHAEHPLLPSVEILKLLISVCNDREADIVSKSKEVSKFLSSDSGSLSVEVRSKVLQCYFAIAERRGVAQEALQPGVISDLLWALAHQFAREEECLGRPLRCGANPQAIIKFMTRVMFPEVVEASK